MRNWKDFLEDEDGATAIEYALVATFIGLAVITAGSRLGTGLDNTFNYVANYLG